MIWLLSFWAKSDARIPSAKLGNLDNASALAWGLTLWVVSANAFTSHTGSAYENPPLSDSAIARKQPQLV